jgi:hypothetical protein
MDVRIGFPLFLKVQYGSLYSLPEFQKYGSICGVAGFGKYGSLSIVAEFRLWIADIPLIIELQY